MITTRRDFLKVGLLALVGVSVAKPVKPSIPDPRYVQPGVYTCKIKDIKVGGDSVWADIIADTDFYPMFDPIAKQEMVMRECGHTVPAIPSCDCGIVHKIDTSYCPYYYQEDKVKFFR